MPRQRLSRRINGRVVLGALIVALADSLSKLWARRVLGDGPRHVLGPLWFRLTYNSGISFSLSRGSPALTTLIALAIVLVVAAVAVQAEAGLATWGFGLLLGGGVSNEVDRLVRVPHRVTDFVSFGCFPVFNLADVAVTGGFVLLIVAMLRGSRLVAR